MAKSAREDMRQARASEQILGLDISSPDTYSSMLSGKSFSIKEVQELIGVPPVFTLDFSRLSTLNQPAWPIEHSQYAAAGELADVYKKCLDDWEPLVGLIAERMPEGYKGQRELAARTHLLALAHLNMVTIGRHIQRSGHQYSFYDYTAFSRFHFSVLDQIGNLAVGQNRVSMLLGWNSDSGFTYDYYDKARISEVRERMQLIFEEVARHYPQYPVMKLAYSGIEKLIEGYGAKVGLGAQAAFRIVNWQPGYAIRSWELFAGVTTSDFEGYAKEQFGRAVSLLTSSMTEIEARFLALKHFVPAFQEPYSFSDHALWNWLLDSTFIWGKKNVKEFDEQIDTSELLNNIGAVNPYSVPGPAPEMVSILAERGLGEGNRVFGSNGADIEYLNMMVRLNEVTLMRHHYPTKTQMAELEAVAHRFGVETTVSLCSRAKRTNQLKDGSLLSEVNKLIGMDQIKNSLTEYLSLAAQDPEALSEIKVQHIVLTGNPGTGKTTVANLLGQVFEAMGLLSNGVVKYVTRADLVASYTGQTAPKVTEAVKDSMGGVLFLDEAYSLAPGGMSESDNFGREAIDELIVQMENNRGHFLLIAAGYPGEMERFLKANPGLRSRFGEVWNIPDYSVEQLWQIFQMFAKEKELKIDGDLKPTFEKLAADAKKKADFSNGRWVRNLLGDAERRRAGRLREDASSSEELIPEDFTARISLKAFDPEGLDAALKELNSLIGLGDIKDQIEEIIALQKLKVRRAKEGLPDINPSPNHLIFSGPPGTGKTTVAKLIGNIYKALGLVSSGHVKETQRADLVAGFVGQTAIKTSEIFAQAEGGVLFIDEAYTLTESSNDGGKDYGQEAVDTILKLMEDHRDDTVVIAAGYEDKMQKFLNSNPGLPSRFGKTMKFLPWSPTDLTNVVVGELSKKALSIAGDASSAINELSSNLVTLPGYASGRTARRLVEEIINSQSVRLSKDESANLSEIRAEDIERAGTRLRGSIQESPVNW